MEVVCEQFEDMHAPTAQEMKALVNLSRLRSQWGQLICTTEVL